jgi:hypothetical protein
VKLTVVATLVGLLLVYAPLGVLAQLKAPDGSVTPEAPTASSVLQRVAAAGAGHRPALQSPIVQVGRCTGEKAPCCCQINAGLSVCMPAKGCSDIQGKCAEEAQGCGE